MPIKFRVTVLVTLVITIVVLSSTPRGQQAGGGARWRTAWSTSQQGLGMTPIGNTTIRLIARTTIGGDAVRIRIDNAYGTAPLKIARAAVGIRSRGAQLVAGSNRPVLFGGAETVTVPPGGTVRSDAVRLQVLSRQDLAVSLFVPEASPPSQHTGAAVTSYAAAANAGDRTSVDSSEPFTTTITTMPWLK